MENQLVDKKTNLEEFRKMSSLLSKFSHFLENINLFTLKRKLIAFNYLSVKDSIDIS